MTSDRSTRIKVIVDAALSRPAADRDAFAVACCGDDPDLLREVRASLAGQSPDPPAGSATMTTHVAGVARWGTLVLFEEVGRGAFGAVHRAFDPALERPVALKLIGVQSRDPWVARRLLHEGRLLARIKHPNIVTVFGAQHIDDQVGVWMELVEGRTLDDIVVNDGPMGPEEAAVVGIAVCGALNAVHGAGLVHRDVKARNVMREAGGRIVLMDFGAGSERVHEQRFELAGTPIYMAPEVLQGESASPESDVYSVGVLLYYLVTAKYPVSGHTFGDVQTAHRAGRRSRLAETRPDLPDWFVRVVDGALAPRRQDRYHSAAQVRRALADGLAATPALPQEAPGRRAPGTPSPRRSARAFEASRDRSSRVRRRRRVAGGAVAAGLLAVVALAGFVASMGFNSTFGRTGPFAAEPPLAWFVWGLRAMVAPAVYMIVAVMLSIVLTLAARAVLVLWPRAGAFANRVRERSRRVVGELGLSDPNIQLQVTAAAGAVGLVLVFWAFADVIGAATSIAAEADRERLAPLGPDQAARRAGYGMALDAIILAVATAAYRIGRRHAAEESPLSPVSITLAATVIVVAVLLLVAPYRVLWHNEFERATFDGARCYVIGEAEARVLLYCPDAPPPRNRVADAGDERLVRHGLVESVFSKESR